MSFAKLVDWRAKSTSRKKKLSRIIGVRGNATYNFPASLGNQSTRKAIGYADIPGIMNFSCSNCKHFAAGRFCTKFHITVLGTACCSMWEK